MTLLRLVVGSPLSSAFLAAVLALTGLSPGLDAPTSLPTPGDEMAPAAGGTCLNCPDYDFGCFVPTSSWQTHAGMTTGGSGDCNTYCFSLQAGKTYEFTTCSPGSADFDTVLELRSMPGCAFLTSDDDSCGMQSRLQWTATSTGPHSLRVRGRFGATGNYTLAYREVLPCGNGFCSAPNATLAPPLTTCQTIDDRMCDGDVIRAYEVDLHAGRTYTFTMCGATCAGAGAPTMDSTIELWMGGTFLTNSTDACGDDGEIVYTTDPVWGDGTYCVQVIRDTGTGQQDLAVGYFVECVDPEAVSVMPDTAVTTAMDCSRTQTFQANWVGTGPYTVSWTITPADPGNTAAPATGTSAVNGETLNFTSVLTGDGAYAVTVTVTNACGTSEGSTTFVLVDGAGPDIECTAEPLGYGCSGIRRARATAQPVEDGGIGNESGGTTEAMTLSSLSSEDAADVFALATSIPGSDEARDAIAAKLGVSVESVRVIDSRDTGVVRPPEAAALSCPTPCTSTTLEADNPFYEVFVSCFNGAFTARTGVSHSVTTSSGSKQNVIFGGTSGTPSTSDITFHVHDNDTNYLDPSGGEACLFDPPDTIVEPGSVGIEEEWTMTPLPGVTLTLREEVVAFGDTEENSGIRLTLGATNSPGSSQPVTMGVRWQIDYQNSSDDGPLYAPVTCEPFEVGPERSTEHEFPMAEIDAQDFYRIQNNSGSPIFANFTSTGQIAGFDGTGKPDRLVYGRWGPMSGSGWNYSTAEGSTGPDSDSATLNYYGYTPADGIVIGPGESFIRSVVIFTRGDDQSCGDFIPGSGSNAQVQICPNECVRIGATATDNCGSATVTLVDVQPATAPPCGTNPCDVTFPDVGTYTYTWAAEDSVGNVTTCTSTVVVDATDCNVPPTCDAGGPYGSGCREAMVDGATVMDENGDDLTYAWESLDPNVTILDGTGVVPGAPSALPVPPATAVLDPSVAPCDYQATLRLFVDDGFGGTTECFATVRFDDVEAPVVEPSESVVACLWPPNHEYVCVSLADVAPVVTDNCTDVTWQVAGCSSNQPDDGPEDDWNGDGATTEDCVISPDGLTMCVRAERAGSGPTPEDAQLGRYYGVSVVAADQCGNTSEPVVVGAIYVPHDQSPAETGCLDPTEVGLKKHDPFPWE